MKIMLVCEGFDRYSVRAQPWKHVYELGKAMQSKGHFVNVLSNRTGRFPTDEVINGLRVIRVKKGRFFYDSKELTNRLNQNFDVVNWNGSSVFSSLNLLQIQNFRGNLVLTLHAGMIELGDIKNLRLSDLPLLSMFFYNIAYSFATRILVWRIKRMRCLRNLVTLSTHLKNALARNGFDKSVIQTVYSGVDSDVFAPRNEYSTEEVKESIGLKRDRIVILYYGPITPFRGADELEKAIPIVSSKFSNVDFVFLGRTVGPDHRSKIIHKRLRKYKNAIMIEGVLEEEKIVSYLNSADVIVLPFRFWPFVECPLTVLEAMAMGKPVVTTRIGAISEIVKDGTNGLLVNPRAEDISLAISRLIEDPEFAARVGKNARKHIEGFHTWKHIADESLAIFKHVQPPSVRQKR